MYKVFIDNKVIVFCEKYKKTKNNSNTVVIFGTDLQELELLSMRAVLPISYTLVVVHQQPEKVLRKVFSAYDYVEAAGGIVRRKSHYLFIERNGVWDIPKGKIERGEVPKEAAVREIEEECGIISPVIDHLLGVTFHTYDFNGKPTLKKNWWYALNYKGSKAVSPQEEEGISQVVWLEKKDWKLVEANTYNSIREVLQLAENF